MGWINTCRVPPIRPIQSFLPTAAVLAFAFFVVSACGRKGPPLPPLVKLPAPPADLSAQRHGDTVDLLFVVPGANTDGTRPANVSRVDVYGITAPGTLTDDALVKLGTKVASLPVKAPRNPNETIEPGEPAAEMEPPEGAGLDQGAVAHATERLTPDARTPIDVSKAARAPRRAAPELDVPHPLLGPGFSPVARTYVGVGVSPRGRRGPSSKRVNVPMLEPPATPAPPTVDYDERAVTLAWTPLAPPQSLQDPDGPGMLPSKPIGVTRRTIAYNVYELAAAADETGPPTLTRLTPTPVEEPRFADPRITWSLKRCYAVWAVEMVEDLSVESDETAPSCVTLTDKFPPAAPKGLTALPSDGAITLIWDANTEKDLRGYIVLRGIDPAQTLEPVTSTPIQEPSFKDAVQPGVRFVYAVKAVDSAGNESALSERAYETAR